MCGASSFAQTNGDYRVKASGAWTTLTTWDRYNSGTSTWATPTAGEGYPGQNSTPALVTIGDNFDITYATGLNLTIGSLVYSGGANESTLTLAGTAQLHVNGAITINGSTTTSGTHATLLAIGTGTVSCASLALNTNNPTSSNRRTEVTVTTGTLTVSGNITCNANVKTAGGATGINFGASAGTLNVGGSFMASPNFGIFTQTGGTINFNGSAASQTIDVTNYVYNNVTTNNTNAGGATFGAAVTATNITGNINVASGLLNTNNLAVVFGAANTLTVATGATFNAGTTSLKFNGGTATINGTFQTANTTAFTGNTAGAISSTTPPTITLTGSTIEYNAAGTQPVTARTDYANVTLTGGSKTITGTVTLSGDLTINSGATYNGAANPTLTVKGDFVNAGTFTQGSTAVTLSGAAAQVITPTAATTFTALTIANTSGGVTLSGNASVSGTLTLTSGILSIAAGSTLTLTNGNAISVTTPGTTKHIATLVNNGTGAEGMIRVNNMAVAAYTFPVGTGTNYLPVTVTPTNATTSSNSYSVCVFTGITDDGTPNGTQEANKANVVDAVWTVNYNGPGSPSASATTLSMNWPGTLEGAGFTPLPNAGIGISHFATPAWGDYQQSSGTNGVTNIVTLSGITSFSPFSVGKLGTSAAALPIKIAYFNASKGTSTNTINWSADCGSPVVTFEIERSADGKNFTTINSITATQARCASPFSIDDAAPLTGTNFYRIKMIDIDGRVTYTSIVKVGNAPKEIQLVGVLPNPVTNAAQLSITTTKKDNIELAVISLDGRIMSKQSIQVQTGSSLVSLDVSKLARGTYFVKGTFSDGQSNSVKFVKE